MKYNLRKRYIIMKTRHCPLISSHIISRHTLIVDHHFDSLSLGSYFALQFSLWIISWLHFNSLYHSPHHTPSFTFTFGTLCHASLPYMFPRRLIPFTRPWHRLLCQPRHFSTANGQHGTSDNTLNIWKDNLQRASAGDAIALCEVGWGHHQGLTPELQKSIPLAIENYVQSAKLGYAPAASLLADIHYYNHDDQKDWLLAMKYFKEVLQCTSPTERNDAYVRSQALQKLGVLAMRGIPNDIKSKSINCSI